jgi:hypothetical protein
MRPSSSELQYSVWLSLLLLLSVAAAEERVRR